MKKFIVLFCLVSLALAQRGGERDGGKRGERGNGEKNEKFGGPQCNVTRPEKVSVNDCCPNKPKPLTCLAKETCGPQCKSKGHFPDICCLTKCAYQNFTSTGTIDANGVINALISQVQNGTDVWKTSITNTVNTCIGKAQADIQKMKDEVAAATNASDKSVFFKKLVLNCSNSDLIVIDDCIRTNLFLNCPTRVTSDQCNALFNYAQACPKNFFYFDHGKDGKGSHEKSAEKKGRGTQKNGQGKQETARQEGAKREGGRQEKGKQEGKQANQKQQQ